MPPAGTESGYQHWHARARKMRADGFTTHEIAQALGKSQPHVAQVVKGLGPSLVRRGRAPRRNWQQVGAPMLETFDD